MVSDDKCGFSAPFLILVISPDILDYLCRKAFGLPFCFIREVIYLHQTAERFKEKVMEEYNLVLNLKEFNEGTKTAADAAEAIGCQVSQIAKSIVMNAGGELTVVIASGANRVDERTLAEKLGVDPESVSPANPDRVKQELGWGIGGVPPFAHDSTPRVFLDSELEEFDTIWAAAGTPNAVFPISPERLKDVVHPETINL